MADRNPAANHHPACTVLALTKRAKRVSGRVRHHGQALPKLEDAMLLACETLDDDEIENIRVVLAENDVVTGPPLLRELVEVLWPEYLHKVKPPRELMH
jgi:hypothetical protein